MDEQKYKVGEAEYTETERQMIKAILKDNTELLLLLRKVFLPKVNVEDRTSLIDVYTDIPFSELSPEDAKIAGQSRNQLINHMNKRINALWSLANNEPKTKEEIEEMNRKNSSK